MERIIADRIARPEFENSLPGCFNRVAMNLAVPRSSPSTIGGGGSQMRDELLTDGFGGRRLIAIEGRQSGAQGAFARDVQLAANGIVVAQIERAQERLEVSP